MLQNSSVYYGCCSINKSALKLSFLFECELCLTAYAAFSQPLKNPMVPFRHTTWRSPYTVQESSSLPAWWALWWCAG